jgi:hypothetical protein
VGRRISPDDAIAGAFEELPTLLVVLVAISLFSVSVAHAAASWGESDDYIKLQEDCQTFAGMVRASDTLCAEGKTGIFDIGKLQNISQEDFLEEFNSTLFGFGYRVTIQCVEPEIGNATLGVEIQTSEMPQNLELASFHTCVNVDNAGTTGAARITVTIWRLPS